MLRNKVQFPAALLATMFIAACGNSEATPSTPETVQQQISRPVPDRTAPNRDDQRWEGTGAMFSVEGKKLAEYKLDMRRKKVIGATFSNAVNVHLEDGTVKKMRCEMEMAGARWTSKCGDSKGGGYCLGAGLCLDHVVDAAAHAFSTTIIDDGDGQLRMLRVELDQGKAVRFFREKLALVR